MDILGANGQPQTAPTSSPSHEWIKEGSDQDFMVDVVEPSKQVPVLVDFWAPWCGPCRQLGPVIEKAVKAAKGEVRLVKINIDENPGIAGQLRIQSIPAVMAFKDGQPVDGFMGALPESQIKDFIARVSGKVSEVEISDLLERAQTALNTSDLGGAAQDFALVLQIDGENPDALAGMARIQLLQGDMAQAQNYLDMVASAHNTHPAISSVRASLELAGEAKGAMALDDAEKTSQSDKDNPQVWFDLAKSYLASGHLEGAIDALITSIGLDREWNESASRQLLLRIFDATGHEDPLIKAGRRKLSALLFS